MQENKKEIMLYIPMGVKLEQEIFNGFGKKELIRSIITMGISFFISFIIYLFNTSQTILIVSILTSIFGSIMLCIKDTQNQSVLDYLINLINFYKEQQVYNYVSDYF
ncbi:MAG: hypothetical protein KIC92_07520 [Clostridiales bacterium]|nr:hypothetical protein [Clostridiales bacterium]